MHLPAMTMNTDMFVDLVQQLKIFSPYRITRVSAVNVENCDMKEKTLLLMIFLMMMMILMMMTAMIGTECHLALKFLRNEFKESTDIPD